MRQWFSSLKRWLVSQPADVSSRVRRSARRALKPSLEILEDRVLPSGAPAFLTATRAWIVYSPSSQVAPSAADPYPAYHPYGPLSLPTDAQITTDLQTLANEGWKGIVTESLLGTLGDIPRIASGLGLHVIAGIQFVEAPSGRNDARSDLAALATDEFNTAVADQGYVDGYVVGNAGIPIFDYQLSDVTAEIAALKAQTGNKPATTSEESTYYLNASPYVDPAALRNTGDWEFPNDNVFDQTLRPAAASVQAQNNYFAIVDQSAVGRTVVINESFWPTAGTYADGTPVTPQDQVTYFNDLATQTVRPGATVYFTWGEAYDQYWKAYQNDAATSYGFHQSGANYPTAKPVISQLQSVYTANYVAPGAPTNLTYAANPVVYAESTVVPVDQPANSGGAVVSYAIAPALPAGLLFFPTTGDIFGTPTTLTAPTPYTITATNSAGSTTTTLTLSVEPAIIVTPGTLPGAPVGASFSQQLTASGGSGSGFSFAATGLPDGLSLSSSGLLSGTPTTAALFSFFVTVTDSNHASVSVACMLVVTPPNFAYDSAGKTLTITANTNFIYSQTSAVDGASKLHATYTFAVNGLNYSLPDTLVDRVFVNTAAADIIGFLETYDAYIDRQGGSHSTRETAVLGIGGGVLVKYDANGNGYSFLTFSGFQTTYANMGAGDSGELFDSPGNDTFVSAGSYAYITGPNFFHSIYGADSVYGYTINGGSDQAWHYDAPGGLDAFVSSGSAYSYMSSASFFNVSVGFPVTYGISTHGNAIAYMLDSPGNDTFYGTTTYSYMSGPGFFNVAEAFALVYGESFVGGTDYAYNHDPGHNILSSRWILLT